MSCRVCYSGALESVIDLGNQPWCNHFLTKQECGKEPTYPLRVVYCLNCQTAQLDYTVKKEIMFGNHTYLSGITRSLNNHFQQIASIVTSRFFPEQLSQSILDIGSNDGTQLKHFAAMGWHVQGVESSIRTSQIAVEAGIPTLNVFFNKEVASHLGSFDVVNASGVFFHLEELHSVTEGIRNCLAPEGVFVIQFLYMHNIIKNGAFDQIYHEHLLYYNLKTLSRLLEQYQLEIFDAYLAPIHGGSMIAFVQHQGALRKRSSRLASLLAAEDINKSNELATYQKFALDIERKKDRDLLFLEKRKSQGKRIFGFGAPVKGNTLLNYFSISTDMIDCLVEKNSLRKGLFSPGMHIPVIMEEEIDTLPDVYYVLAWNFKQEILKNNQDLLHKGVEFYFPVDPDKNEL